MVDLKDIPDELIDALLADYQKPDDLLGKNGILEQLTKRVVERSLQAEMTHHLGHEKHGKEVNADGNTRNGTSKKTLKGKNGSLSIAVPRDRDGSFEPQFVEKNQTHWQGFDDVIISLYARGMSVREIQGHLKELYHTEVSPALISAVTDEVADEVRQWQGRPLDAVYTPSCTLTASTSKYATRARSAPRPCTWLSGVP
jgi:putative transposase